jgi:hypothetical protein
LQAKNPRLVDVIERIEEEKRRGQNSNWYENFKAYYFSNIQLNYLYNFAVLLEYER